MRAKINAEVEEIMRQVNAEREAEARGETYTPSADDPLGALDAFAGAMSGGGGGGGAAARTPQPPPSTPPLMSRDEMAAAASRGLAGGETPVDAGILSGMLSASDSQLGSLRSALAGVEKALRARSCAAVAHKPPAHNTVQPKRTGIGTTQPGESQPQGPVMWC